MRIPVQTTHDPIGMDNKTGRFILLCPITLQFSSGEPGSFKEGTAFKAIPSLREATPPSGETPFCAAPSQSDRATLCEVARHVGHF